MTDGIERSTVSSLAALAAHAPNAAELLRWVGLQRRQSRTARWAQGAGWFGAGVALGGGLALLLTPQSGAEMRRRLSGQAQRVRDAVAPVQPS